MNCGQLISKIARTVKRQRSRVLALGFLALGVGGCYLEPAAIPGYLVAVSISELPGAVKRMWRDTRRKRRRPRRTVTGKSLHRAKRRASSRKQRADPES